MKFPDTSRIASRREAIAAVQARRIAGMSVFQDAPAAWWRLEVLFYDSAGEACSYHSRPFIAQDFATLREHAARRIFRLGYAQTDAIQKAEMALRAGGFL